MLFLVSGDVGACLCGDRNHSAAAGRAPDYGLPSFEYVHTGHHRHFNIVLTKLREIKFVLLLDQVKDTKYVVLVHYPFIKVVPLVLQTLVNMAAILAIHKIV
jgi:hypothetical protein